MNCRCAVLGFSLLGAMCLVPQTARGSDQPGKRPLQLGLAASAAPVRKLERVAAATNRARPDARHGRRFFAAEPSLQEKAFQSLLAGTEQDDLGNESGNQAANPEARFRFERQGSAVRQLSSGYRNLCATVSSKVWDDPDGKRIKFDVAGKPGVAVEIPLR